MGVWDISALRMTQSAHAVEVNATLSHSTQVRDFGDAVQFVYCRK